VEDRQVFMLHFGFDGWNSVSDRMSSPVGRVRHQVRIEANEVNGPAEMNFTRYYPDGDRWEGINHIVALDSCN
jgi:hypothetical protein